MDWSESGYLALSALNVKDGYIDFSQDVHYGNQELYDKWMSGKELHRGQVLFTTEAPMGNVAQVPDNKGYILSQRTIAFDVEEKILSENFLATLLRTPNVFNDLIALSSGGTAKGVSQKSLSGLDVVIPKNIDEQNKLADYFINLDNLITLHQRKYLQKKKTSLTWEQRKLNELLEKYEDPVDTPHNGYERIGIRSHAKGTFHSFVEPGKELDTAKMHRVASDKFILNITFAWEHAVAITDENDAGKLVSHRFPQFSFDEKLKSHFFKYLMLDRKFKEHLELSSPGGAGRNRVLKISDMLKYEIKIPSIGEQTKIAKYLDELDHLITLHRRAHFHRRRRTYK